MTLLLNAFSANMLESFPASVKFEEISAAVAVAILNCGFESAVGHADTAAVFGAELGLDVPANRVSVSLKSGQTAVVGQYSGPRLAEGTTTLPDGATIKWLTASVE